MKINLNFQIKNYPFMNINKNNFNKLINGDTVIDEYLAIYITNQLSRSDIYYIIIDGLCNNQNKILYNHLLHKVCENKLYAFQLINSYVSHNIPHEIYLKALKTISENKKYFKSTFSNEKITKNISPEYWREGIELCLKEKKATFKLIQNNILTKDSDRYYWEKAINICLKNIKYSYYLVNCKILTLGNPLFDKAIERILSKKNPYISYLIDYQIINDSNKYYNKILKIIKKHENKS